MHNDETPHVEGYDSLTEVGRGGFATVYRARQEHVNRTVALKVLSTFDKESSEDFYRLEARNMGLVSGLDQVVEVFAVTQTSEGEPCIVMEYFPRGTLGQRLAGGRALPAAETIDIGLTLCDALDSAHRRDLIHDDIKPPNIFIDSVGKPVLGDFGIAAEMGELWRSGRGLTRHYAAPERVLGRPPTLTSDVYGLAATLYRIVSGRRAFDALDGSRQSQEQLEHRILNDRPPRLDATIVPAALQDVIFKGLSRDPGDRQQSAVVLADDLRRVRDGLAGNVRGGWRRSSRIISVACLAALIAGITGYAAFRPEPAGERPAAITAPVPEILPALPVPHDVVVLPVSSTQVSVEWTIAAPVEQFEVRRADSAEDVVTVSETSAVLDIAAGETPCVEVRSIGAQGQISNPSAVACLNPG